MKQPASLYTGISGTVFLGMLVYLLLRAWYVAPMHDEVATFFHFIETGHIWDQFTLPDANNHLLNSYLGRGIYLTFGTHFFLFRLPSVLAFCLYFWAARKLTLTFPQFNTGFLVFISLVSIPWITDYFSYTRGYALAISFFLAALVFLWRYTKGHKTIHLAIMIGLLWLSVFANFTYLISSILIAGFAGISWLVSWKRLTKRQVALQFLFFILFLLSLVPFINYSFDLKEAGALYYGSLDGLWWVTGKTLSRFVLFFDADWLRYVYLGLGLLALVGSWRIMRKLAFKEWVKNPLIQWGFLIVGNLAAILFLAKVMHVNYPEDRAAMYLVPLCLLAFGFVLSHFSFSKFGAYVFLFFPITFLMKTNLNTSVFSPDDRMTTDFYQQVKAKLDPNDAVAVYPIMQLTWALHERNEGTHHIGQPMRGFSPQFNIILSKNTILQNSKDYAGYEVFAKDPASTYIALKRTKALTKTFLFEKTTQAYSGTDEFILLLQDSVHGNWKNRMIAIDIDARLFSPRNMNTLNIVCTTEDAHGKPTRFHYQNVRWYVGENAESYKLHFPLAENNLNDGDKVLKVYLWNPDKRTIRVKNGRVQINALN